MADETSPTPTRPENTREVVLRLEGKFDSAIAVLTAIQSTQQTTVSDHETRIRVLEARQETPPDHEARLSALEHRQVLTPRALLAGVGGITAVIATIVGTIFTLISHVKIS